MENSFGIIGGMGPLATQLFYKILIDKTPAKCDQDHINTVILGHATIPDRTSAILSGDSEKIDDVCEKIYNDAMTLQKLGCLAIGVTCNTAHYFVDKIADRIKIPFIHMIKETAKEVAKTAKGEKVCILATDGTIQTGLYQEALVAEGVIPCTLEENGQSLLMHEIYDCIKAGKPIDNQSWESIEAQLKTLGCKKAIMACTELSVIKAEKQLPGYYVDPMEVLADRALELMGKK